jgi:hypothetical protein
MLVALSAADLFMTRLLLQTSEVFYESNPLAQYVYDRWDVLGMAVYKFGLIGGVLALSSVIERHRPGLGKFVVLIGCIGAFYAVGHGTELFLGYANAAELD